VRTSLLFLLIFLLDATCVAAASEEATPQEQEQEQEQKVKEELEVVRGVFYGRINVISHKRRNISVQMVKSEFPFDEEPHTGRRTFYFDKQSLVRIGRKKYGFELLELGQKVAVRYFGEPGIYVVDELFLVRGNYQPFKYKFRKMERKRR